LLFAVDGALSQMTCALDLPRDWDRCHEIQKALLKALRIRYGEERRAVVPGRGPDVTTYRWRPRTMEVSRWSWWASLPVVP
jgi:hypothetical protein